jgi:hypothetical protein
MTLTNARKLKCIEIFNRIDDHIPFRNFAPEVLKDLEEKGIEYHPGVPYNESQVYMTRNRRSFHVPIAEAFERLYAPKAQPVTHSLAKRQKLVPPVGFSS